MGVTWGDAKNATWKEVKNAGLTWGDAKTMTSREFFQTLENKVEKIRIDTQKIQHKMSAMDAFQIIATLCGIISTWYALMDNGAKIAQSQMQQVIESTTAIEILLEDYGNCHE